jgi:hypothetical protein
MLRAIQYRAEFTVNRYEIREVQDAVSVRLFVTLTSRATGESVDTSVHELYTVRDGKVFDVDVYYKDTAALRDFLPGPVAVMAGHGAAGHGPLPLTPAPCQRSLAPRTGPCPATAGRGPAAAAPYRCWITAAGAACAAPP